MVKPSFKVVTNAVVLLALLGVITKIFQPHIPPAPQNFLANSQEAFLRQAAYQSVKWRTNTEGAFSRARRDEKPILFLIGTPWSSIARQVDQRVFADPDVSRFLARRFVCVRIDASEDREWLNAFLPYSRMPLGISPGFQPWILDSRGYMVDLIGRSGLETGYSADDFVEALIESVDLVGQARERHDTYPLPDTAQQADFIYLRTTVGMGLPDFQGYAALLGDRIDPRYGGFSRDVQRLHPNAFRYLLLAGKRDLLRDALDPVLFSPMYDIIDGGFYQISDNRNGRIVSFDKIATLNADMLRTLSLMHMTDPDPAIELLGRSTVDAISLRLKNGPFIATCRIGTSRLGQRSPHQSIGLTRMRRVLDADNTRWMRSYLGLEPMRNPQMIPFFENRRVLIANWQRARILASYVTSGSEEGELAGTDSTEAHCHSAARLIEAARWWGDVQRLEEASTLAVAARSFVRGGLVSKDSRSFKSSPYLGDWLAFSDVCLQDFLANGRESSLSEGLGTLNRALIRFRGILPGEYLVSVPSDKALMAQNASTPELADNIQESCTARIIRLCDAYGALLAGTAKGDELRRKAVEATSLYSQVLRDAGPQAAGYHCAALGVSRNRTFFAVGPQAVAMGNKLSGRIADSIVAPAVGMVRPDLQTRKPGIYRVDSGGTVGPMTVEEAVQRSKSLASERVGAP